MRRGDLGCEAGGKVRVPVVKNRKTARLIDTKMNESEYTFIKTPLSRIYQKP